MIRCWLTLIPFALVPACDNPAPQDAFRGNPANQQGGDNSPNPAEEKGVVAESGKAIQLCRIKSRSVRESSGIAVTDPELGSFWTHNDSGDNSGLYLISTLNGELISTVELAGAGNADWEDMAHFESGGKQWLLVADIGDNELKRKEYKLYLFDSSRVDDRKKQTIQKQQVHEVAFVYEDGPHDCEAVAVAGNGKSVLLVEKRMNPFAIPPTGVYQFDLPIDFADSEKLVAKRIAGITAWAVTGMDVSPDQNSLIIRSYTGAQLYRKQNDQQSWAELLQQDNPAFVQLPVQQQGEAICFTPDGQQVLTTSEGIDSIVWQVDLPKF